MAEGLRDRYAIERELGRGGMATVYLARDLRHERPVALKVLRAELAATLGPERFRREIQTAARLQHPHICTVYDSGETAGMLWFTMPYVRGESVRDRLAREGHLPLDQVLRIIGEAGRALDYAHREGFVHRDIKPGNLLLTSEGDTLVADFGVARALDRTGDETREHLTETGVALGTATYMAPEQATGERGVDARADQYALAVTCWELLAGRPPFEGPTAAAIVAQRFTGPAPSVGAVRPDVPWAVDQVLARAMALAPADRFETVGAFVQALGAAAAARVSSLRIRRPSGRRLAGVAAAALVIAAALFGARRLRSRAESAAGRDPRLVAVFPFAVRADSTLAYLGEGMVDLLSSGVDGAGDLRSVDPRAVLRLARGRDLDDPLRAREAAARLGAGRYVLGSIVELGGRLRATASLYDDAGVRRSVAEATAADESRLFELVDGLTRQLLAAEADPGGATRSSATSTSLPALKAYLAGQSAFRQGRYDAAAQAFERAVAEDSGFALAEYGLSLAAWWSVDDSRSREMVERAVRHAAGLGTRERRRLEALAANRRGQADSAEALYRRLVVLEPDDPSGWFGLGDALFEYNPRRGRPASEAREPLNRALALEPASISVRLQLAYLAALERDYRTHDSLLAPLTASADFAPFIRAVRAFAGDDRALQDTLLGELRQAPATPVLSTAGYVAILSHDLPGALAVAGLLTEPSRPPATRARASRFRARIELARGRWDAARAELAGAAETSRDPLTSLATEAMWALLPPLGTPPTTLAALRARLEASGGTGRTESPLARDNAIPAARTYVTGLLSARLKDGSSADRAAAELERAAGAGEHAAASRRMALGIRAELALARGDTAGALAALGQIRVEEPIDYLSGTPLYAAAYERYRMGQLLGRTGHPAEGAPWLEQLGAVSDELPYVAPAQYELARLYDAGRDHRAAATHYRRFLELWADADPALQPMVRDARERLREAID